MLLIYYQRIDLKSIETLKNHKINSNCYSMDIDNIIKNIDTRCYQRKRDECNQRVKKYFLRI